MTRSRWFSCAVLMLAAVFATSLGAAPASPSAGNCKGTKESVRISDSGGLGRIEWGRQHGAVLQRDEGIVSILEPAPRFGEPPRIVGRYDDGAQDSFDGDLTFVDDRWLLYARQTHQFSKDGIHVLDLADSASPRLAFYQPQGGTLRIAHFRDGTNTWVFTLDAIDGLVINLFDTTTGALLPVHASPLPALKVGGPASAGLYVDRKDPMTGTPLLYVATGRTGVEVLDISNPAEPVLLGTWSETGLAEIEVRATKSGRTIYGATEYWFDKQLKPAVVVLNATKLASIKEVDRWSIGAPADDRARVQGMTFFEDLLYVAHSGEGLVGFNRRGWVVRQVHLRGKAQDGSAYAGSGSIAFDVERYGWGLLISDAATGRLTYYDRMCWDDIFVLDIVESREG